MLTAGNGMTFDLLLGGGAFLLALALAVFGFAVAAGAIRLQQYAFQTMMLLLVAASVATIALSGRDLSLLDNQDPFLHAQPESHPVARALQIAAIGLSLALCVAWLLQRGQTVNNLAGKTTALRPATDFAASFVFFYAATVLFPLVFGKVFYFHVSLLYPLAIYLALLATFTATSTDPAQVAKRCLSIIVVGSLLAAGLAPALALDPAYTGLIPGLQGRLLGLTASANTLGAVAAALLVMEVAEPSARRSVRLFLLAVTALVLLMTQSKTSIAAAMLGIAVLYGWRLMHHLRTANADAPRLILQWSAAACIAGAGAVLLLWMVLAGVIPVEVISRNLEGRALEDLATATGRIWIWDLALQGGLDSPLFGQGVDFWNLENRIRYGLSGAVHAHNQFLQNFSQSGLVGLFALLLFLTVLVRYALRAAQATRGGSLALLMLFLTRAMFEVPLQPTSVLGAEFFVAAALFAYVVSRGAEAREKQTSPHYEALNLTARGSK